MTDFSWKLLIALIAASVPGTLTLIPFVSKLVKTRELPLDKKIPPAPVLLLLIVVQTLVIVTIAATIGTALAHRVSLKAPAFEALVSSQSVWDALQLPEVFGAGFFF